MRRSFSIPDNRTIIEMTEMVNAPIERAWTARIEPIYVSQWWIPTGYTNPIVEYDVVPGGRWRIVQRDPEGHEFSFYGTFHTVEPPKRLVQTWISELFPEVTIYLTTEFEEIPGGTKIVSTQAFGEESHRRGYLNLGGVERMTECSMHYDRLLAKLAQGD